MLLGHRGCLTPGAMCLRDRKGEPHAVLLPAVSSWRVPRGRAGGRAGLPVEGREAPAALWALARPSRVSVLIRGVHPVPQLRTPGPQDPPKPARGASREEDAAEGSPTSAGHPLVARAASSAAQVALGPASTGGEEPCVRPQEGPTRSVHLRRVSRGVGSRAGPRLLEARRHRCSRFSPRVWPQSGRIPRADRLLQV